jgi:putative isomerase
VLLRSTSTVKVIADVFFLTVLLCTPGFSYPSKTYHYTGNIEFDISRVPFSSYGSYLGFSQFPNRNDTEKGLYLRDFHGGNGSVFKLMLLDGKKPVPFVEIATPSVLHLKSAIGSVDICFETADSLRIRGRGVSLQLSAEPHALSIETGSSHWQVATRKGKFMLWPLKGTLQMDAPWTGTNNVRVIATFKPDKRTQTFEGEIDTFVSVWQPHKATVDFDGAVQRVRTKYQCWLEDMPDVPRGYGRGAELAAYIDWESVVAPHGHFSRPAMLMSKNWMTNVWSWDQCFNAMALSFKDPELAWDQYMLPIDNQGPQGAFPDAFNDELLEWEFTKPPIQGWVLNWMLKHGMLIEREHLIQVYSSLSQWTRWHFLYRQDAYDGLLEYYNGDDSGWDNSTAFVSGVPVETPDLDAYLVVQMDTLSRIAKLLGKDHEATQWRVRSDNLLNLMINWLWKGNHFVALRSADHRPIESHSLELYLPLVLGDRLPPQIRKRLVEGLAHPGRFLTKNGFATEALASKYYTPDGYWRGPIWAPITMILAESLDSVGEHQLAHEIRVDFCSMAQRSGMSENFDAITGTGLRDPAYTWTSSVYLILAHELLGNESIGNSAPVGH